MLSSSLTIINRSNYGYLNMLYNFNCFASRLGLKYLVVALDKNIYTEIGWRKTFNSIYSPSVGKLKLDKNYSFRTPQFNYMSRKKLEASYKAMNLGFDVVFIDVDVVLVNDPIPPSVITGPP